MTRDELLEFHDSLTAQAKALMAAKNHDYAGPDGTTPFANFQAAEALGVCSTEQGFLVRMLDKFKRLATFTKAGRLAVADEGFTDACIDIVNYAVLFAAYCASKPNTETEHGPTT